jgi:hypothetical protein
MRRVTFRPRLAGEDIEKYVARCFQEISEASNEDAMTIADNFGVSNFTASKSIDVATVTLPQLASFVATLVDELQRRGKTT